ncbi:class I SAM-dependent methyltransferase [Synechococcus elongatus]|uniref:class I SAM-dependent methyltransferase n=1 Tax=Synechococcus elongatus TaxID=32046 RepID=UPI0030CFB3D5
MAFKRLKNKLKKLQSRFFHHYSKPQNSFEALPFLLDAYQVINDQQPDLDAVQKLGQQLAQGLSFREVLKSLIPNKLEPPQLEAVEVGFFTTIAAQAYYPWPVPLFIDQPQLNLNQFNQLWEALPRAEFIIGQADYLQVHKTRFWELLNAVKFVVGDCPARLLEFGNSEVSALYPQLIPTITLDLSDRVVADDYIGFTEAKCRQKFKIDQYFSIDLEHIGKAEKLPNPASYDCVVFTEVLEHLCADPQQIIEFLLSLLKPSGQLILSTPNYFRSENLSQISQGKNPQPYHPGFAGNWDGHYHYREYSAIELDSLIKSASGTVAWGYYSSCWDGDESRSRSLRGNLVVGVRPNP